MSNIIIRKYIKHNENNFSNKVEDEKNKILGLTINYHQLKSKFRIPENINDYNLTKEFLVKVLYMLNDFKYGENNSIEDDLPF